MNTTAATRKRSDDSSGNNKFHPDPLPAAGCELRACAAESSTSFPPACKPRSPSGDRLENPAASRPLLGAKYFRLHAKRKTRRLESQAAKDAWRSMAHGTRQFRKSSWP